jgi:hypothetical protein
MNVLIAGSIAVGVVGLSSAIVLFHPVHSQATLAPQGIHNVRFEALDTPAVPEIAGYHNWAKVNTVPQYIASRLDMLCRAPTQAELDAAGGPHVEDYMLCYVNGPGADAMLHEKHPTFPVGSIVVKEKLDQVSLPIKPGSKTTERPVVSQDLKEMIESPDTKWKRILITAMIKHAAGYDPAHGDWEYLVTNGDATALQARGKLANCGGCHAIKKNNDFVFRDELDADKLAKLK